MCDNFYDLFFTFYYFSRLVFGDVILKLLWGEKGRKIAVSSSRSGWVSDVQEMAMRIQEARLSKTLCELQQMCVNRIDCYSLCVFNISFLDMKIFNL